MVFFLPRAFPRSLKLYQNSSLSRCTPVSSGGSGSLNRTINFHFPKSPCSRHLTVTGSHFICTTPLIYSRRPVLMSSGASAIQEEFVSIQKSCRTPISGKERSQPLCSFSVWLLP